MNQKVSILRPGGLNELVVEAADDPVPGEREALIRVEAAGVAFGDILMRRGAAGGRFPQTPGYDLVGVVQSVGPNTSRVRIGDCVAALPGKGAQQQLICLAESGLVAVPPTVPSEKAVAVVLNYMTALRLLTSDTGLKAGQSAFVYGLVGGLGSAMAQVAKQLGIRLYGTASGSRLVEAKRNGAVAFDRNDPNWVSSALRKTNGGFNAVFDPIGGSSLNRSYSLVAPGGTLVMLGVAAAVQGEGSPKLKIAGTLARFLWLKLRPGGRRARLSVTGAPKNYERFRDDLTMLLGWLADGKIDPAIHAVLPLGEVRHAQEMLEASGAVGKIVLTP